MGASDLIRCIVDISIASAGTALETIGVESKNTLLADTSSAVSPVQPGLLQAQVRVTDLSVQSITTVVVLTILRFMYAVTSPISGFGHGHGQHLDH